MDKEKKKKKDAYNKTIKANPDKLCFEQLVKKRVKQILIKKIKNRNSD